MSSVALVPHALGLFPLRSAFPALPVSDSRQVRNETVSSLSQDEILAKLNLWLSEVLLGTKTLIKTTSLRPTRNGISTIQCTTIAILISFKMAEEPSPRPEVSVRVVQSSTISLANGLRVHESGVPHKLPASALE